MSATYVVQYSYVSDIVDRRQPYRAEHLGRITAAASDGLLLLSGALADPVDGAVLVFRADSRGEVEEWVHGDPYLAAGLITDYVVREITLVVPTL